MSDLEIATAVVAFLGLISLVIGVSTFLHDSYQRQITADTNLPHSNPSIMGYFAPDKPSPSDYLFCARKTVPQQIPKV
jgi:hypothetical protein